MDDDEREALRAEGLDPDDPAVVAAIDMVRWELSLMGTSSSPQRVRKKSASAFKNSPASQC
jgi:hypothetical protein